MRLFFALLFLSATSLAGARPVDLVCIGDSITQGLSHAGANGGYTWRYWLWKSMLEDGYLTNHVGSLDYLNGNRQFSPPPVNGIAFDKDCEGHSAWTADQILNGRPGTNGAVGGTGTGKLSDWLATYTPGIAIVMIGTNDCLRRQNGNSTANEVRQIVRAIQNDSPGASIFVCSLPKTTRTEAGPSMGQLNAALDINSESWSTAGSRVTFVNCTAGYQAVGHNYDGLHPNAQGERFLAGRIYQKVKEVLGPPDFETWIAGYPEIPGDMRGAGVDYDGDGLTNLEHFYFGGDPAGGTDDGVSPLGLAASTPEGQLLTVRRRRHLSIDSYIAESSDLRTWELKTVSISTRARDGFYDELTVLVPPDGAAGEPGAKYWRLEINDLP